ncbi:reverse transcriptase family protein [Phaeobacter piscinae]|uniref:reverse transcriptase family protein n=1 Tax=Phaeobacter piscinae TaxID=1580596 RepID=UPI000BBE7275
MKYVEPLVRNRVPVIFGLKSLSDLLGIQEDTLSSIINSSSSFYRSFKIPKRSGGRRQIDAPYPSLLHCQRWIAQTILPSCKVSTVAHAYLPGRSILTNAKVHCGANFLLKMDFKDFFPSISDRRLVGLFLSMGYSKQVSVYLAKICSLKGTTPQGSPASPALSNAIARRFDLRLLGYARSRGLKYTRYADDIAISGEMDADEAQSFTIACAISEGFQINHKKTRYVEAGQKMVVTGLDISTGRPRPTRQFRREVEKEVFYIWRYGVASHVNAEKIYDPSYILRLKGKLDFWRQIEPDHPRFLRCSERFRSAAPDYLRS